MSVSTFWKSWLTGWRSSDQLAAPSAKGSSSAFAPLLTGAFLRGPTPAQAELFFSYAPF